MTSPTAQYSKPITIAFCSQCTSNEVAVRGLEINVKSKATPNVTIIAGAPSVYQEDIIQFLRGAGVNEGRCSVKVDLKTKEIVFLNSSSWDDHQCAETFESLFTNALASSRSKK